jgi:hypothetical protein
MTRLLEYFDDWCTLHSLTYWIDFGVLLGARRHGSFVPWDYYVDVGMPVDDFARMVEQGEHIGCDGEFRFGWACPGLYRVRYRGVSLDVLEYEIRGELCCPTIPIRDRESASGGNPNYADHPVIDVFPLTQLAISGRLYPAPRHPDACLERLYGAWERYPRVRLFFLVLHHPLKARSML